MNVSTDPQLAHLMEQIHEPYGEWILKVVVKAQEKSYLRQDLEPELVARLWMNIGTTFDMHLMEKYAETKDWGDLTQTAKTYADLIRRALVP